jgi:hypothetical protein
MGTVDEGLSEDNISYAMARLGAQKYRRIER